jgi:hypothetical protein
MLLCRSRYIFSHQYVFFFHYVALTEKSYEGRDGGGVEGRRRVRFLLRLLQRIGCALLAYWLGSRWWGCWMPFRFCPIPTFHFFVVMVLRFGVSLYVKLRGCGVKRKVIVKHFCGRDGVRG